MEAFRGSRFAQALGFGTSPSPKPSDESQLSAMGQRAGPASVPYRASQRFSIGAHTPTVNAPVERSLYEQIGHEGNTSRAGQIARAVDSQWLMNYQEATIYLEEGSNNDQFSTHPKRRESLPAYMLAHTSWFYILDLIASLVLLSLAFVEAPAAHPFGVMNCLQYFCV